MRRQVAAHPFATVSGRQAVDEPAELEEHAVARHPGTAVACELVPLALRQGGRGGQQYLVFLIAEVSPNPVAELLADGEATVPVRCARRRLPRGHDLLELGEDTRHLRVLAPHQADVQRA